jgi:hypothetical protein
MVCLTGKPKAGEEEDYATASVFDVGRVEPHPGRVRSPSHP